MTLSPSALEAATKAMQDKRAELQHFRLARIYDDLSSAAITAYLAAREADGWVMVPKIPSSAMLDRAVAFALNVTLSGDYGWSSYMRDLYARMLTAAQNGGE